MPVTIMDESRYTTKDEEPGLSLYAKVHEEISSRTLLDSMLQTLKSVLWQDRRTASIQSIIASSLGRLAKETHILTDPDRNLRNILKQNKGALGQEEEKALDHLARGLGLEMTATYCAIGTRLLPQIMAQQIEFQQKKHVERQGRTDLSAARVCQAIEFNLRGATFGFILRILSLPLV